MTKSDEKDDQALHLPAFVKRHKGLQVHVQCLAGAKRTSVLLKLTIEGEDQHAVLDVASQTEMQELLSLAVDAFVSTVRIRGQHPRSKSKDPFLFI